MTMIVSSVQIISKPYQDLKIAESSNTDRLPSIQKLTWNFVIFRIIDVSNFVPLWPGPKFMRKKVSAQNVVFGHHNKDDMSCHSEVAKLEYVF